MAKKKQTPRRTRKTTKAKPSKPPKAVDDDGGGGALSACDAVTLTESAAEKNSAMNDSTAASSQAQRETDFLTDWKANTEKLRAAREALRGLPASEYENIIREVIRAAPSAWHLRRLILHALDDLKHLSKGHGDSWRGIADKDQGVIGRVHYQLARIAREFNVSLTSKSTPRWLLEAKKHPEFQKAWKESSNRKGEHEKDEAKPRVIEVDSYNNLRLRCTYNETKVEMKWLQGDCVVRQETRDRISSNGVLQHWLADVLTDFDKWMDRPGNPLGQDWAERWANEELYLKHFMPHAEREWKPDEVDELQASACGLLTTNNGSLDGKPRYDFDAFATRIRRLAKRQLRHWRDVLVPPAPKVSQK